MMNKLFSQKFLFCILLSIISLYLPPLHAQSADPTDSLELVDFFNSTGGPSWSNPWDLNQAVNTWNGVLLNGSGQLISLNLDYGGLSGTMSDPTFPALTAFSLEGNNVGGPLPSFANCPNLTHLILEMNNFSGAVPDFNLPNLIVLRLGFNNLSSVPLFSSLPSVEVIELFANFSISGPVPDFNLPTLGKLDLGFCSLSGSIPDFLNCPNLWHLNLGDNYGITGDVPDFGTTHPNLSELYLQVNQLENISSLAGLTNLFRLSLGANLFTFEDLLPQAGLASGFYFYSPQEAHYPLIFSYTVNAGDSLELQFPIDPMITDNVYTWYLDGVQYTSTNSNSFWITNISVSDAGTYTCEATNPALPNLTLQQYGIQVNVTPSPPMAVDPADSAQLVNLFTSTNGPNWTNSWTLTQAATTWAGVSINASGRVSAISLPNNGLSGALPALDLPQLTSLNLENNALAGAVPDFSTTPALNSLLLANNLFDSCPELVGRSAPDTVSLYGNQLTFEDLLPNAGINRFEYAPQAVTLSQDLMAQVAGNVELHFPIDSQITSNEYVWIFNGGTFDTTTSNSLILSNLTFAQSGEYSCQASNPALPDLILELKPFQLTVEEVNGLEQLASDEVRLFPNPTIDLLQFSLAENLAVQDWHIRIMDLSGKVIIEQQQAGINHIQVDVSKLAAGVYVAELIGDQHRWTSRWMKVD